MKPLSRQQVDGFLQTLKATRDHELNCTDCGNFAAEFAERELAGLPLDEALARVKQHLEICPQCREELLALKKILEAGK